MDSIVFKESYLALYEAKSQLEISLSIIDTFYENSNENDTGVFKKISNAFNTYISNTKKIIEMYSYKRQVKKNLKIMKKVIDKNPSIGKEKITYRVFSDYKHELDYYSKISKNLAYRTQNIDKKWMTDLMDSYYKNMDTGSSGLKKITINESIEEVEDILNDINKYIEFPSKINDELYSNIDKTKTENVNSFKKVINTFCKSIQTRIYIFMYNIEMLYSQVCDKVNDFVKNERDKVVIDNVTGDYKEIRKNSKKVDTVNILGNKIDLYESDKYIESEFVTGSVHPRVYFDKSFSKLPPVYQKAILYHEYGHVINGHLGTRHYRDEYKLDKKISRRVNKYLKQINSEKKDLASDDLLVYLLIELEADEFSAKFVGRNVVKKSLEHDYEDLVNKSKDLSDEDKLNTLFVGQLRRSML